MPVRLNGSTSGYVELAAPAVAGSTVLTLPTDSIKPALVLIAAQDFSGTVATAIDSCFTSVYENYLILCNYSSGVLNDYVSLRFRSGGSDNSTTNYQFGIAEQNMDVSTLAARTYQSGDNRARVGFTGSVGNKGGLVLTMMSPQLATQTVWNLQMTSGTKAMFGGGDFIASTQFDGFKLYSEGGANIAGSLRVYGYRNSL